jgi:hypothetical protein
VFVRNLYKDNTLAFSLVILLITTKRSVMVPEWSTVAESLRKFLTKNVTQMLSDGGRSFTHTLLQELM